MPDTQPVVSICCITYNHEKYIRDAIEGFLMQETDFPIEIIIHDDASTDNTPDIIREYADKYPNLIVPIFQTENQYSQGKRILGTFVIPRARGKYIALCEGDDYWTSPHKLQRQVDYMTQHPCCPLCAHNATIVDENNAVISYREQSIESATFEEYIMGQVFIATAGVVFRTNGSQLPYWFNQFQASGDWQLYGWLLAPNRKMCFLPGAPMAVYRKHVGGVTSVLRDKVPENREKRKERLLMLVHDYSLGRQKLPHLKQSLRFPLFRTYVYLVRLSVENKEYEEARRYYRGALAQLPAVCNKSNLKKMAKMFLHVYLRLLSPDRIMT